MNYIVQMIRFLLIPLILCFSLLPAHSSLKGGVDYQTQFDYTKLNQAELESQAVLYYDKAVNSCELDNNMTTALNIYTLLSNAYPENITYSLRLGYLYELLQKDRYAKGYYYRAMGINQSRPEPYFYLGEFFYKKEQYRKALKYYIKAYDNGYSNHYMTLEKIGTIYRKFGDTEKAVQYLQCAESLNPNKELEKQLKSVNEANQTNKEFYRK